MLQLIRSLYVLLSVSFLFLVSEAQFFDIGSVSLGGAPVGFISRVGAFGDGEGLASLGNAPVGVHSRRQYPLQAWYQSPFVKVYPPARPLMLPPVKPDCRLPGPCREQTIKIVRTARPPPARPYKPQVRPHPKPQVRPKPVVPVKPPCGQTGSCGKPVNPARPPPARPYKPVVRPSRIPTYFVTRKPSINKQPYKPEGVRGRNSSGGLFGIGGLIGNLIGGLG